MTFKNIRLLMAATAVVSAMIVPHNVQAKGHEKVLGVTAGYVSRNQSVGAGLFFQYGFSTHFRMEADAGLAFRHHDRDAFLLDVNCHVPFRVARGVELYPLLGANYSAWAIHTIDADNGNDVTTRKGRFGINAGGGLGLRVTSTLKLKVEAEFTGVKANNGARINVSIGYSF